MEINFEEADKTRIAKRIEQKYTKYEIIEYPLGFICLIH